MVEGLVYVDYFTFGKNDEADKYGGQDDSDWQEEKRDHYSDKGGHKARGDANKDKQKEEKKERAALFLSTAAFILAGCVPAGADAVTTPAGIFYRDAHPPAHIVEHEQCHWDRAQQESDFFTRYASDPEYACEEERRCGIEPTDFPEVYPQCQ